MPKLFQINVSLNYLSTGKISEGISQVASANGWECYTAYSGRYFKESDFTAIKVSTRIEELIHYAKSLLFDMQGLGSCYATNRLVRKLELIQPDIIHLHVIHGSFINYKILFEYACRSQIPIVWTMHDCWAFTGHCVYFDRVKCDRWKTHCKHCIQKKEYPSCIGLDRSSENFELKRRLLSDLKKLTMVPVSNWLADFTKQSFLRNKSIQVIHNGIDLSVFAPTESHVREHFNIGNKFLILGVANGFGERKGLDDFIRLSQMLGDEYKILLVGVHSDEMAKIPNTIIALPRTGNQKELVELYSAADVFANPTYEDNFPTTNLEALACGTPIITYKTGGSPEAIDEKTGIVVEQGNLKAFADAIIQMKNHPLLARDCIARANQCFDKNKCFQKYIELYNRILIQNKR